MLDNADWKQKYRNAIAEMEFEEKRWCSTEKVLRHLVNRLCAAGMGVNSRLDEELAAIASANRRGADAAELESFAAMLTDAVATVDKIAPAAYRLESTRAAAAALVARLVEPETDGALLESLRTDLANACGDAALAAILARIADLVHERGERAARERAQSAVMLAQVGNRLEELAEFFDLSSDVTRSSLEATQSLNVDLMQRVRDLSNDTRAATDLRALQLMIDAGLQSVDQCVREFRSREESRLTDHAARADRMRARIAALEQETRELHGKLAEERKGARIDSLTGIANRRAFDERYAEEIERCAQDGGPAALLLWDIDRFKFINDSYGHRAGDRVIQIVAKCLESAVRATDFIARIGGEEFAVLLPRTTTAEASRVAEGLRAAVAALRFHFRGTPVVVTASCGIAELAAGVTGHTAFERADEALYLAKSGGRNRCIAADAARAPPSP